MKTIQNSKFKIQNFPFQKSKFSIPKIKILHSKIQNSPFQNSKFPIPKFKIPIPNSKFPFQILNSDFKNTPNFRSRKLSFRLAITIFLSRESYLIALRKDSFRKATPPSHRRAQPEIGHKHLLVSILPIANAHL